MLWQSSLLIAVLLSLNFVFRRKIRAAVRYSLWLVVLVKLLLPPTLALPTGVVWWMRPALPSAKSEANQFIVSYGNAIVPTAPAAGLPQPIVPPIRLSLAGWAVAASVVISFGLLAWMIFRWRYVARVVRAASPATEPLKQFLAGGKRSIGLRRNVRLCLTNLPMSPAICGLFRPVSARLFMVATSKHLGFWRRPLRGGVRGRRFDERTAAGSAGYSIGFGASALGQWPLAPRSRPTGETYPAPVPHWPDAPGCDLHPGRRPARDAIGSR
jgi:hypothetical protein